MKRLIYSFMMAVVVPFFIISCGAGNKKSDNHDSVHEEETHVHSEETHTHENGIHSHGETGIPFGQEDFFVGDSIQVDSLKQDSLNHDHDHNHDHEHEHNHQH